CSAEAEQRRLSAGPATHQRGGKAHPPGPAGDDHNLAEERLLLDLAELCLLERPIFDIEEIGLAHRFEAADRLRFGHRLDRGLRDVGGDRASLAVRPSPNRPSPGTRMTLGIGSSSRFGVAWRAL